MNSIRLIHRCLPWRALVIIGAFVLAATLFSLPCLAQDKPKTQPQDKMAAQEMKKSQAKTAAKPKTVAKPNPEEKAKDRRKEEMANLLKDIKKHPDIYRVGPSDILSILVWKEDDISRGKLLVRPDGRISLPLLDDILAAGRTPMQLKYEITERLKKFIEAPRVYIAVVDPRSKFFCVLGHVKTPGHYPMLSPTTVLQALAQAGGFDEWADEDSITIVRGAGKDQQILPFDYSDVTDGDNIWQNVFLEPGDVIVVP